MISGSFRVIINTEDLNSVESIGNLTKHRTAPIVVKSNVGYSIYYVPVISGESIAHAYQSFLADLAKKNGLPVGVYSSQYEFIKYADEDIVKEEKLTPPQDNSDARRFEVDVILHDVVADVGGFLYAGEIPVRRTSRVKFGYMVPAVINGKILAQLETQFHVRYSSKVSKGESEESRQKIFNVELSSALYTLSFSMDEDLIAVPSNPGASAADKEKELEKQRPNRVKAAIEALYPVLLGNFGGKRSRFLPHYSIASGIVTVTDFPFMPEPAQTDTYIDDTIARLTKATSLFNGNARAVIINREGLKITQGGGSVKITTANSVEEVIDVLLNLIKEPAQSGGAEGGIH
ncbi:type I-A CRISPR-associated protein Cas7/Csa2 [Acidilobus sp.]|uniref:type I-A CRISPR-associated protein Cas7/Csa2 n=1 Tax=Acidilobus sp. TaxID=1872109 RepID=UPI003D06E807